MLSWVQTTQTTGYWAEGVVARRLAGRLSSELGVLCDVSKLTGTRLAERLSEYDATAAAGKPGR